MLQKTKIHNKLFEIQTHWSKDILSWYKKNKRDLPWRQEKNQNFYSIWLSEIMLQQTVVQTVIPYYTRFKKKWPDLKSFQLAKFHEVLKMWQGLGYYKRAKHLYEASKIINNFDLENYNDLLKIPGIGSYTASAILAILYDKKIGVIDTNIKRIFSRVFSINFRDVANKKYLEEIACKLTPINNNKFYCQSLMDIGSLICKKKPLCKICPISKYCDSNNKEEKIDFIIKKKKPRKIGVVFFIRYQKQIFVQKSNDNFLHGLMKFPTTEFSELTTNIEELNLISKSWIKSNGINAEGENVGFINHQFTNFYLKLLVVKIHLKSKNKNIINGIWINENKLSNFPFSRLMEKVQSVVIGSDE